MSGLWASYNRLLEAQPLLTKALTSLTGFTLGDILAQKFIEPGDKPYDVMRTVRLGFCFTVPLGTSFMDFWTPNSLGQNL